MRCSRSPKACGWLVAYSMNSMPSIPSGLDGSVVALKEDGHLGSDFLISRLPLLGKKICLVLGHLLMLYATWLVFSGALAQARINLHVEAPVTGASMAFVYGTGVVFAVFAAVLLLRDLWRILTGQLAEADLVMIKGTEEKP